MVLGYFGKTPIPPDATIVKIAMDQLGLEPTVEHLDYLEKDPARGVAAAKTLLKAEHLPVNNENIFIVATCAEKGVTFLKGQGTIGVRKRSKGGPAMRVPPRLPSPLPPSAAHPPSARSASTATFIASCSTARTHWSTARCMTWKSANPANRHNPRPWCRACRTIQSRRHPVRPAPVAAAPKPPAPTAATKGVGQPLITQLPGLVLRIEKPVGSAVKVGDTVLIIESMKMDNAIVSSVSGTIAEVHVKQGDQVQAGQELALIR